MSHVSYLVPDLKLRFGDIEGNRYSDQVYEDALVSGTRMLMRPLNKKYLVVDGDVIRNPDAEFESDDPYIEYGDEEYFLLAALTILHLIPLSGSNAFVGTWSTPDLSVSNVQGNKAYLDLYNAALKNFNDYIRNRLGKSIRVSQRFNSLKRKDYS